MKRREFIAGLGGAAVAWPIVARAEQASRLPTIGYLGSGTPTAQAQWVAAFVQRLRELGWVEGRTVAIEYHWAEGRRERAAEIAAEYVRLKVDVIIAGGTEAAIAAKQATSVIPIVFPTTGDPVGTRLVHSLARPGGNATGLSNLGTDLAGKQLEILREVFPALRQLATMVNAEYSGGVTETGELEAAARTLGLELVPFPHPAHRRYRGRLRGSPGAGAGALCNRQLALACESAPHQHLCPCCPPADDVAAPGLRPIGWADVLWRQLPGFAPAGCRAG